MIGLTELIEKVQNASGLYLYGAGIVASGAASELEYLTGVKPRAFAVTDTGSNPADVTGIPVISVSALQRIFREQDLLLVAVPEEYQSQIRKTLQESGIWNIIFMDSLLQSALTGRYISEKYGMLCLPAGPDPVQEEGKDTGDTAVYMAVSHLDKPLLHTYEEASFVRKIQVGAGLTKERLSKITDEDDMLSLQNPIFGELTAVHWIWKNDRHRIKGLYHYRRVLDIRTEDIRGLLQGDYDVILPMPYVCRPDTSMQYGRYLNEADVDILLSVLKEKYPEDYPDAVRHLKGELLYNYNILITRGPVFDAYAEWLFDILAETADRCEKVTRERKARYIGRLGEVLTSIYFTSERRAFRIANAGLIWRV